MAVALSQIVTEDRASGALVIDGSLRFDSNGDTDASTSQRLARTFGSAGDNQKMTMSVWVKRTVFTSSNTDSGTKTIFGASGTGRDQIRFEHDSSSRGDQLSITFINDANTANECFLSTGPRFRDPSAWYHVVWAIDTTQGTPADRVKLYVNGTQITDFSGNNTQPGQNFTINCFNNNVAHEIGRDPSGSNQAYDGYMSNFYWIDGQQLDASHFGFTDPLTNTWRPKKYTGTFGTNGFWLPLDGNSPIGEDKSGRGNNWTPANFSGSAAIDKADTLPVINTTGGGKVASIGSAPDSLSANLKLAYSYAGSSIDSAPTGITTFQANGATFTKGVDGGPSFYTDVAPLYMTERSNQHDYPRVTFSAGAFNFMHNQTGSGTMECWFYNGSFSGEATIMANQGGSDQVGIALNMTGSTTCQINLTKGTSGNTYNSTTATLPQNEWHHLAVTKSVSGSTCDIKLYIDGVLAASNTGIDATTLSNSNSTHSFWQHGPTIGNEDPAFNRGWVTAYIKDFRVYDTVKYTGDFIVGSVDPDILPDTPSGVAGGSALTSIPDSATEGAVAFDNAGSGYLRIDRDTNTDFEFGTGDLTIEFWAFIRETGDTLLSTMDNGNYTTGGWLFESDNQFRVATSGGTIETWGTFSYPLQRWIHVAVSRSGSNVYGFIDGVQQWTNTTSINIGFGGTNDLGIGAGRGGVSGLGSYAKFLNGSLSNLRIIKGTALYTENFTPPTSALTNVTNTKLLCCQSTTSATAAAVNPGTLEVNGTLSATKLSPFLKENINTVRGQESGYCTLNPLNTDNISTFSDGNLSTVCSTGVGQGCSSGGNIGVSSGKWYCEMVCTAKTATNALIGICTIDGFDGQRQIDESQNGGSGYGYVTNGTRVPGGTSYGTTWDTDDIMGIAMDLDSAQNTVTFYKNGVSQGAINITNARYVFGCSNGQGSSSVTYSVNFGQKPFKYAPPEGFKTLCLANLDRPSKVALQPDKYFGIVLYNGDGGTSNLVTGLSFQPDLVWGKCRSGDSALPHNLFDVVRGFDKQLDSNNNTQEVDRAGDAVTVNSTGFTLDATYCNINNSSTTNVAWCWKAGGAAVENTDGTITSQVSANRDAGFSIVTYTGAGGNSGTVGHGLNVKPKMVIAKARGATDNWVVYTDIIDGSNDFIKLNSTDAKSDSSHATTTSTTFNPYYSQTSTDYVAYCWHDVPGFSKFGTFEGNDSTDGCYVHLGFKPALVIAKQVDTVYQVASIDATSWGMWDSTRMPNNPGGNPLWANKTATESVRGNNSSSNTGGSDGNGLGGFLMCDLLSNGFKARSAGSEFNSAGTHIYMAWAEAPTQNLYGGQANAR